MLPFHFLWTPSRGASGMVCMLNSKQNLVLRCFLQTVDKMFTSTMRVPLFLLILCITCSSYAPINAQLAESRSDLPHDIDKANEPSSRSIEQKRSASELNNFWDRRLWDEALDYQKGTHHSGDSPNRPAYHDGYWHSYFISSKSKKGKKGKGKGKGGKAGKQQGPGKGGKPGKRHGKGEMAAKRYWKGVVAGKVGGKKNGRYARRRDIRTTATP